MSEQLAGKSVLVVEDEYFIASDLKRALEREGAVVLGPASGVDAGMTLIGDRPVDAAVLDVNLDGRFCFPLLDRLIEARVPCLLVTGYDQWALPEPYRQVRRVAKPFAMHTVIDAVGRAMVQGSSIAGG
jgi:DNA-binding NtrC family response regulator